MSPERRRNLQRLLKPRHVALIGGADAVTVAGECARIGFEGPIWPVNPKREEIGGHRCFASVRDLPEAPDAVFLAIPREPAIDAVRQLNALGAGGVVCFTAGFGEMGDEGAELEAALVAAAGDMALVGPNCYGVINYLNKVALWPFAHGGFAPGYGAAIITQSGMLASDLSMSQRSVPFACMISAGNQAVLALEDYVDVLCGVENVRAFGLHIEGLKDIARFAKVAEQAMKVGKPIVALKTGSSSVGARLTESHTGSLSGSDELYSALFEKLGVIRVHSPAELLETLKFLMVAGLPAGRRIAGFTCSGGGATMLADYGEKIGLEFSQPSERAKAALRKHLPHTATVSNPLDYTTPIWGDRERVPPVFSAHLSDAYDAALIVQDYPAPGLNESKQYYLNDACSFVDAVTAAGIPGAVCSVLPENMDAEVGRFLVGHGVAPMQGLRETLDAVASAAWLAERRAQIVGTPSFSPSVRPVTAREVVDEAQGKAVLQEAGVSVPDGIVCCGEDAANAAQNLGFPVALKMIGPGLLHKTELGAVVLNLLSEEEVGSAAMQMAQAVAAADPDAVTDTFLVERMQPSPLAELLVSIRNDPQFGTAMTLASGGTLVELIGDAATLLLPAADCEISAALAQLRVSRLLDGFRGAPKADHGKLVSGLQQLAHLASRAAANICEIEINPLYVYQDHVCAVDVLLTRYQS